MIILPAEKRLDWKRAPLVLIVIVLINILVFFFYQSADTTRYEKAVEAYMDHDFLRMEWPIYQEYLQEHGEAEKLESLRQLYDEEEEYYPVAATLLEDREFYAYLDYNGRNFFYEDVYLRWYNARTRVQADMDSISYRRFGLKANAISAVDLITHMFLHGDFMHLLGNMVFLMICGFAVEAALGHATFVVFYLLGGVVAGLTNAWLDVSAENIMIGASGAISAVMAMYLVLFRWRRIQFFYWFYVVAGYFRAPALVILPVYISKEIYSYYFDAGSNVAFMAHAGGFVAGAVLIFATALVRPAILNSAYLDEAQDSVDSYRQALADIYEAMEKYRFESAEKLVQEAIAQYGNIFQLQMLQLNLKRLQGGEGLIAACNNLLQQDDLSVVEIRQQESLWLNLPVNQTLISNQALLQAAINFTQLENIASAEQIFNLLRQREDTPASLARLARYLAKACARLNQVAQHKQYEQLAIKLQAGMGA